MEILFDDLLNDELSVRLDNHFKCEYNRSNNYNLLHYPFCIIIIIELQYLASRLIKKPFNGPPGLHNTNCRWGLDLILSIKMDAKWFLVALKENVF